MNKLLFSGLLLNTSPIMGKGIEVKTPFGKVIFDIHFPMYNASDLEYEFYELEGGIKFQRCEAEDAFIEILTFPYEYGGIEFQTDGNQMQVFRLCFKKNVQNLILHVKLLPEVYEYEYGQNSGEFVDAISFEFLNGGLTIGTNDYEYLITRAKHNDWIPSRWKNILGETLDDVYPFKSINEGFQLSFPETFENEKIQINYTISWVNDLSKAINARFAADIDIRKLLIENGIDQSPIIQ